MKKIFPGILGVFLLCLLGIYAFRLLETSRTEDPRELVNDIADANALYQMETGFYATGAILDNDHPLIGEDFVPTQSWREFQFQYEAADHPRQPCYLARARTRESQEGEEWIVDLEGRVLPGGLWSSPGRCGRSDFNTKKPTS